MTAATLDPTEQAPAPAPAPAPPSDPDRGATAAVALAAAAAFPAAAAVGWMAAGVFPGFGPKVLALLAAAIGPAAVVFSLRVRRPAPAQVAGIVAVLLAAGIAGLAGGSGSAGLGELIARSLRGGGLAQAPVPFDPGWRFVLVLLAGLLGMAGAGLAASTGRPRLPAALSAPVLIATTLIQPADAEVVSAVGGLALVVASLGVAATSDLVRDGGTGGRFEVGRAVRGAGLLAALAAALVVASQVGVLLPEPRDDTVVPPQRPKPSPPLADRELFRVESAERVPWRLGTLDVYDGEAWLTPPYDPSRFEDLGPGGAVPFSVPPAGETITAEFELTGLEGRAVPSLAGPVAVTGEPSLQVDPRTQVLRLPPGASTAGRSYRVVAPARPAGDALAQAPSPGPALRPFLEVPPAPPAVAELIESLPDASDFDRLQAARERYYAAVVAAGPGQPVDVTPQRVAELLAGREGSPYEIAAGEAILARWVGVPSRLGYGWFGGDDVEGTVSVRPDDGATWLEVWFEGHGWVPIVGKPPRAKSSLSDAAKDDDPSVRPTDRLTVFTYVPIRLAGLSRLTELVQYWAFRAVPLALLAAAAVAGWPAVAKRARRRRRIREATDPSARVSAAYADLRDTLTDLGGPRPVLPPLEAAAAVEPDDEHMELAWLVTRGLWGDLARDLGPLDAARAEEMAASVRRRTLRAHPLGARLAAATARASLREPWGERAEGGSGPATRRAPLVAAAVALAAVVAVAAVASARTSTSDAGPPAALSEPPAQVGDLAVVREPGAEAAFREGGDRSLVATGRVYSLHRGQTVEGSLQQVALDPDLAARSDEVVDDLLRRLGGGGFTPARFGATRGYSLRLPEQQIHVWFSPDLRSYWLLVARSQLDGGEQLFAALLGAEGSAADVPVPDPRRSLP